MKATVTFYLWIYSTALFAQIPHEGWFDYDSQANGPAWIFTTDYGYITFSGLADIETYNKGCLVTGLNVDGEVLWHKPLWSNEGIWPMNFGGAVIEAIDSGYYLLLNKRITEELSYPVVLRVNQYGDTLWSKALLADEPGFYSGFSISQSPLGDLFMAGQVDIDPEQFEFNQKFTLMKADSEANYLWHLNTTVGNYPVPISIVATESEIVVGGKLWDAPTDQSWGITKDLIRKFDYDGTPQWTTKIHVPPAGAEAGVYSLVPLVNGNYLYATGRSGGTLSGSGETSNTDTQPTIGEIDGETGDTIVEYEFHDQQVTQQFFKLIKLSEGGYLGVGQHIDPEDGPSNDWPIGFMIKLDENLNQVWYRYFVPSIWEGMGRWNNLTDVVENENGTYTAVGLLYTYTGDGPQGGFIQDTYIITVDSLGCIVPGCEVSVEEFNYKQDINIYPNPTKENLIMEFPFTDNWTISIYNSYGQIVFKEFIMQSGKNQMSVSALPVGIYFAQATTAEGKIFTQRFIKT